MNEETKCLATYAKESLIKKDPNECEHENKIVRHAIMKIIMLIKVI